MVKWLQCFAGRTGWSNTYWKIFEMRIGSVLRSQYDWITQNSFREKTSQVNGWSMSSENSKRKNCNWIPRYGLENYRKSFFFCLKNRRREGVNLSDDFQFFGLRRQTNDLRKWKLWVVVVLVCFHSCKIYHLVLWINVQKVVTKVRQRIYAVWRV